MDIYQKLSRSIFLVAIATTVLNIWPGSSFAPGAAKAFYSIIMILSVIFFPYTLIKNNDFDFISNIILRIILVLGVVAILRSVFNFDSDMYVFGNKWMTLFGNEYCALHFCPPLFTYLAAVPLSIACLKSINRIYMLFGAFFVLFFRCPLAYLLLNLSAFIPFLKRDYKILVGIAVLHAIVGVTMWDDPTRVFAIWGGFALMAYVLVFKVKRIFFTRLFCVICLILPFFLFIPLLFEKNINERSFFEEFQTYAQTKTEKGEYTTDTRTFLYHEMALDLTRTESWIWGKGAFAHYYSFYFDEDDNGRYGRLTSEVLLLNLLMRGGVVYVFFYFLLLAYAVYKGLWKSRNHFVQCIAVSVTGWFFCGFVADLIGCRYYHIMFFILLGCCLSNRFLNMSDEEIFLLLNDSDSV